MTVHGAQLNNRTAGTLPRPFPTEIPHRAEKRNILFICGSLNQTRMMHKISLHITDADVYFTPYYAGGVVGLAARAGVLDFTILGGEFKRQTLEYLNANGLKVDYKGVQRSYDLIYTCSDLIIPPNIKNKPVILVQEGMTDPENWIHHIVVKLKLPLWLAGTSATGLSGRYVKFCAASEGYKEFFVKKGIPAEKIVVTGIPNFDNCLEYCNNRFPYRDYVLAATSDSRETFKYENRRKFIRRALDIADGRLLIFKLHPNENPERAEREIRALAPEALVFSKGNTEEMIANCAVLVTRYSSVVYVGLALGKEVHSEFDVDELRRLMPVQNGGSSAAAIAAAAEPPGKF